MFYIFQHLFTSLVDRGYVKDAVEEGLEVVEREFEGEGQERFDHVPLHLADRRVVIVVVAARALHNLRRNQNTRQEGDR